jgi:hypothetical protein
MGSKRTPPPVSVRDVADFLGIDPAAAPGTVTPATGTVSAVAQEGWRCAEGSPLCRLVAASFPVSSGPTISLLLTGGAIWCIPPARRRGYTPAVELQLVVRDWRSPVQQLYLPELPLPVDGQVPVDEKTLTSARLEAWYERELVQNAKAVARRLRGLEAATDAEVRTLFPHDIWYAP